MRIRALLLTSALIAIASLGTGPPAASAARLYTTAAHATYVANGTIAVATAGTVTLYSGRTVVNSCATSGVTLSVSDNGQLSDVVSANIIYPSTFSSCRLATAANVGPPVSGVPWRLSIPGSGTTSGSQSVWSASVNAVSVTFAGGTYTGNLTSGVSAAQPAAAGAPISVVFSNASRLAGPLCSNCSVTGTYTLTGTAASYSLG